MLFWRGTDTKLKVIRKVVEFTKIFCEANQIKMPQFSIVTNGTLLTPEIINFLKEHKFKVTVSLDGPKKINDLQRKFASGKGTHDRVVKAIKELKREGMEVDIEATFTRKHVEKGVSVKEVLEYMHTLDADIIHIMPVLGVPNLMPANIEELAESFREAAYHAAKSNIKLQYCLYVIESLITKIPRIRLCPAGIENVTVSASGNVYPCYFLLDDNLCMGNVFDKNFPGEKFFKIRNTLLRNTKNCLKCRRCWARNVCLACYGATFSISRALSPPPEEFCSIFKATIEGALLGLSEIAYSTIIKSR